jgi:hypothetical protein
MAERMEVPDEWDGPCFSTGGETESLAENDCECTDTNVSEGCVFKAIEDWKPSTAVLCVACFVDTPIDSAHQCLRFSRAGLLDRTFDKLRQLPVRNKIYVHYLNNNHMDFDRVWENFCLVYARIINNRQYLSELAVLMLEKDSNYGQFI